MSLSDAVIGAVVFQNVTGENRFCVIGSNAGRGDGVCCFDVAVAMIYGDNFDAFQFFHLLNSSSKNLIVIKNALFSVDLL